MINLKTLSRGNKIEYLALFQEKKRRQASKHLWDFTKYSFEKLDETLFHKNYYEILNAFIEGKIKRLIISIPPQHGKSLGSSEMLPAFILGKDPNKKVAISSYSATQARKFNRRIQRLMDKPEYKDVFPKTRLSEHNVVTRSGNYLRNADEFEVVGYEGGVKVVGRGGALTGNPVDIMIMDDMYKDSAEGNSPVIREAVWDYYLTTVKTRLHNDSQEIIVFTRWHEDDLIGRIQAKEEVVTITSLDDIDNIDPDTWVKINFEAIKESEPTDIDPREKGDALWEKKHSADKLNKDKNLDPIKFSCLHQGNPTSAEGLLYGKFKTYATLPTIFEDKNYTDTADTGVDYLCSVCYGVNNGYYYVTDIVYTDKSMEYTEEEVPKMLLNNNTKKADIESNNGGRGFSRVIQGKVLGSCSIDWFYQSQNKESRILTNSNLVTQHIIMPEGWESKWPVFYEHLTLFKKIFKANKQDGGPDVLTGIIEKNNRKTRRRFITD